MSVKGVTSTPTPTMQGDMVPRDKIAMRAYDKWCRRGRPHGTDTQDWIEAEKELREEYKKTSATQRR